MPAVQAHRYRLVLICALIAAVVFLAFMPALENGFVNWDDQEMVYGNPHITSLDPAGLLRIFTRPHSGPYVPLVILSYALEYKFFRLNPLVFHLTNILLHVANVLLVFWLMRLLLKDFWAAALVALLFGLHPLRVESVAWVTERKDVLSGLFFLAALVVFVRFRATGRRRLWYLIPPLYGLAVLAKPMALTLPAVLLLVDYLHEGRLDRRTMRLCLVLGALALPLVAVNIRTQVLQPDTPSFHLLRNFLLACRNIVFYILKILVPVGLSPLYPYPAGFPRSLPVGMYAGPALVAVVAVLIARLRHRSRAVVFSALFYFVTIVPVSQFIPIAGPAMAADRYTYLPSLGIFFGIGAALIWLDKRLRQRAGQFALTAALAIILFILAVQSNRLCRVWKDSLTLWNHVLIKYPNSSIAYNNRGRVFQERKDLSRALDDFNRAIIANPRFAMAYYNRGVTLFDLLRYEPALADMDQAIALDPGYYKAYNNRGLLLYQRGEIDLALQDFERALTLNPGYAGAYSNRGLIRQDQGRHVDAIADFDRAIAINPDYAGAYNNRGLSWLALGQTERAIRDYSRALAIDPRYVDARHNRARANLQLGEVEAARDDVRILKTLGYPGDLSLDGLLKEKSGP